MFAYGACAIGTVHGCTWTKNAEPADSRPADTSFLFAILNFISSRLGKHRQDTIGDVDGNDV
jgi:hypothetical protein